MSDVKPGRREMYAAQTNAAVLDAAKTLFIGKGFDATSVEDIANLAQASKELCITISATNERSSPGFCGPRRLW